MIETLIGLIIGFLIGVATTWKLFEKFDIKSKVK